MDSGMYAYDTFVEIVKRGVFILAAIVAVIALVDWLVRTRRVSPFGPIGRFSRRTFDPLMRPVERRIVRAGGQPSNAPWWALAVVVVGGLLLITLLQWIRGFAAEVAYGVSSPSRFGVLMLSWGFALLRIALLVRVISSWFRISEYSKWIRWSFVLTEWMLAPIRRMIPLFGPVDVSPLVAFLLLTIVQRAIGIP
jgi:YggT family protein